MLYERLCGCSMRSSVLPREGVRFLRILVFYIRIFIHCITCLSFSKAVIYTRPRRVLTHLPSHAIHAKPYAHVASFMVYALEVNAN